MADPADVARLRRLTDEPAGGTYDNPTLSAYIDEAESVEGAALVVWREKAASYAGLVDVTEGGSSRRLSQLKEHALSMIKLYSPSSDGGVPGSPAADRPRSRRITRG